MKVLEDHCVHRSASHRSVQNGETDPTPDSDLPLILALAEELQQGQRVVAPQIPPRLRTTLEVSFPALGLRAEVVSDAVARN